MATIKVKFFLTPENTIEVLLRLEGGFLFGGTRPFHKSKSGNDIICGDPGCRNNFYTIYKIHEEEIKRSFPTVKKAEDWVEEITAELKEKQKQFVEKMRILKKMKLPEEREIFLEEE
jgi:hypothetical protein